MDIFEKVFPRLIPAKYLIYSAAQRCNQNATDQPTMPTTADQRFASVPARCPMVPVAALHSELLHL